MIIRLPPIEKWFAVIALLFYSELLSFQSLFNSSEGAGLSTDAVSSPLSPLLQLAQHGIFMLAGGLIILRWKSSLYTASKTLSFWCLLAIVLSSFLWSDFPDLTQRRSLAILETTTFGFYFAARFSLKEQLQILSFTGTVFTAISLLFSVAIPSQAIESGIHAGAWRGPLLQKNLFARVLVLFFIASYLNRPTGKLWNAIRLLTVLVSFLLVILSGSKSALAVLIIIVGFIALQRFLYRIFLKNPLSLVPAICTVLLLTISTLMLVVTNASVLAGSAGRDLTLSGRTTIWHALLTKIGERPFLGYGYEGFWKGIYGESAYVGKVYGTTYIPPHSHNGFLELLIAFGLIGFTLFVLSLWSNAKYALALPVRMRSYEAYWPLVYLWFIILYNQTESTLIAHNSIFWALYVALTFSKATALREIESEKVTEKIPEFSIPTSGSSLNGDQAIAGKVIL